MRKRSSRRAKLVPYDWNFTVLPDEQLKPACYYEYARESATIVARIALPPYTSLPRTQPLHDPLRKCFREQSVYLHFILEAVKISGPWQSLCESKRKAICDRVIEYDSKANSPAFLPFNGIRPMEANQGGRAIASFDAIAFRNGVRPIDVELGLNSEIGVERLVAEIDWGTFNNSDIVSSFDRWLKANRPPAFPESVLRGKKPADWRARIERLGLLRLRNRYTFTEAKPFLAQLYRPASIIKKYQAAGECNREAKKAVADFHCLFPFLDTTEMPRSWPMK